MTRQWTGRLALAIAVASLPAHAYSQTSQAMPDSPKVASNESISVVYYWRARPGRQAAYSEYIRDVAEPIDAEARKAGVFEDVHTYTPAIVTGAPGADWTHVRVFRLKNFAALDRFSAGLDAAAVRVFPDETKRRETMGRSADLRDLVRQEIWRDFR